MTKELREPPLLNDDGVKTELEKYFTEEDMEFPEPYFTITSQIIAVVRVAQKEADIKWMKENCYLKAKRNLPKCKPVSICPQNAYKEAQLDMLKEVEGVSFKAVGKWK